MKPSQRKFKSSYSVRFNVVEIEKEAVQPYKERIKHLKDIIRQREEYIYKLHWQIRRPRPLFYAMAAFHNVNVSMPKFMNPKRILILFLLKDKTLVSVVSIQNRVQSMTNNHSIKKDLNLLKNHDLLFSDDNKYYTITDMGRQFISYYENNVRVHFSNNMKYDKEIVNVTIGRPAQKFKEGEIERRREFYRHMMAPFWEIKMHRIPKDKARRIGIMSDYMKRNNMLDDEIYRKLIFKWSSKK